MTAGVTIVLLRETSASGRVRSGHCRGAATFQELGVSNIFSTLSLFSSLLPPFLFAFLASSVVSSLPSHPSHSLSQLAVWESAMGSPVVRANPPAAKNFGCIQGRLHVHYFLHFCKAHSGTLAFPAFPVF
jgi:hypothetical protein